MIETMVLLMMMLMLMVMVMVLSRGGGNGTNEILLKGRDTPPTSFHEGLGQIDDAGGGEDSAPRGGCVAGGGG